MSRIDCIRNGTVLSDGTRIDGHRYISLVAFNDRDTDRWYYVMRCTNCGHCDITYSDDDMESELYPEIIHVGGGELQ